MICILKFHKVLLWNMNEQVGCVHGWEEATLGVKTDVKKAENVS